MEKPKADTYVPKIGELYWEAEDGACRPASTEQIENWYYRDGGWFHRSMISHRRRKHFEAKLKLKGAEEWASLLNNESGDESGSAQATSPRSSDSTRSETDTSSGSKRQDGGTGSTKRTKRSSSGTTTKKD